MRRLINKFSMIMDLNPNAVTSEDYRTLRANIQFSSFDKELRSIVITSADSKEGKTTTAVNLAIAFAQTNKKVLLVDADLRKPEIHDIFNKPNRGGITNIIADGRSAADFIQDTHINHLSFLASGPKAPNAAELLSSHRLSMLLSELKEQFDVIVIDTPPVNQVSDAQIIAAQCDGALLVVQAGKAKRQSVMKAKDSLELVKARMLGFVLNNAKNKKQEKLQYDYA